MYLKTIKEYMEDDDDFNWNYGIALGKLGQYQESEQILLQVQNERYKSEYCYNAWLAKAFILNGKPEEAWALYMEMDTSNDALFFLQYIANEYYKQGNFFHSL